MDLLLELEAQCSLQKAGNKKPVNKNTSKSDKHVLEDCSVTLQVVNVAVLPCFWEDIQTEYNHVQILVYFNCMTISANQSVIQIICLSQLIKPNLSTLQILIYRRYELVYFNTSSLGWINSHPIDTHATLQEISCLMRIRI